MTKDRAVVLGVLGGMGPLAAAEFLRRLVLETPAETDAEHLAVVLWSDPRVPDRVRPILEGTGPSPVPALVDGIRRLEAAGASLLAMPCNTAHHWYDELARATERPFVSIASAVAQALGEAPEEEGSRALLLATRATLASGFYREPLARRGWRLEAPEEALLDKLVLPAIRAVKRARLDEARELLGRALAALASAAGCPDAIVLGCTELSVVAPAEPALGGARVVDSTVALARACLRRAGLLPGGRSGG